MTFRIVTEKRGEAVIGFRVQKETWPRCPEGYNAQGPVWRNRGRRVFTVADAQELQDILIKQSQATMLPIEYEEIRPLDGPVYATASRGKY
jgi:hypothetical protein